MTPPRDNDEYPGLPDGWEIAGYINYNKPEGSRYHEGHVSQWHLSRGYDVRVGFEAEDGSMVWRTVKGPIRDFDQLIDYIEYMMDKYGIPH